MNSSEIEKKLGEFEHALLPFAFEKLRIIRLLEITLLIRGHILIEDLPGVGKTTLAKAFSAVLGRSFSRIQGTSDTLPQDIIGGEIIDFETKAFTIKKGPIFQEIVLIDEINRMHPKTQSAFLEAMEEKQISIAGKKFPLPKVHLVMATQNPLELKGTYPLPEAQRDRFACFLSMGFPDKEIQKKILSEQSYLKLEEKVAEVPEILSEKEILDLQEAATHVSISDEILERLIRFAEWTRNPEEYRYGISPRGLSIFSSALRANAVLNKRDYVIPEDGIDLAQPFLSHRIEPLNETIGKKELNKAVDKLYAHAFQGM